MSNHYYRIDTGEPCYTVETKTGGRRNTNVADARKLGLVPSYSTIVSLLNKEGINLWMQDQIMEACVEWPYGNMSSKVFDKDENYVTAWKKEIKEIAGKMGRQSRERGTMVHDLLEKVYKGEDVGREHDSLIFPVLNLVANEIGTIRSHHWVAEQSFAYNGYGGKVDLHTKHIGAGVVLDFKTKDVDDIKKMKPYPNDVMQHAAYRDGLGLPHAKCYTLFVNVKHPGMLTLHEWKEEQVSKAGKMFSLLKQYWYLNAGMKLPND